MEGESCKNCVYYHRHYILDEQGLWAINCGHCTFPRIKHRKPGNPACGSYIRGEKAEPLRKQYLTMELLQWLRSLELPPEVFQEE